MPYRYDKYGGFPPYNPYATGPSCPSDDVQEQAVVAFKAMIDQLQDQLKESRDQTQIALETAQRTIRNTSDANLKPQSRMEENVSLHIKNGDLSVSFSAPRIALEDPDVRDAFAMTRGMLKEACGKRKARRNQGTS